MEQQQQIQLRPRSVTLGGREYGLAKTIGALTNTVRRTGLRMTDGAEMERAIMDGGLPVILDMLTSYMYECHRSYCMMNGQPVPPYEEFALAVELLEPEGFAQLQQTFRALMAH